MCILLDHTFRTLKKPVTNGDSPFDESFSGSNFWWNNHKWFYTFLLLLVQLVLPLERYIVWCICWEISLSCIYLCRSICTHIWDWEPICSQYCFQMIFFNVHIHPTHTYDILYLTKFCKKKLLTKNLIFSALYVCA